MVHGTAERRGRFHRDQVTVPVVAEGGDGAVAPGEGGDPAVPRVVGPAVEGAARAGRAGAGEPAPGVVLQQQFVARRVPQLGGQLGTGRVVVPDPGARGGRQDETGGASLRVVGAGQDRAERVRERDGAAVGVPALPGLVAQRIGHAHQPAPRVEGVHGLAPARFADGGPAVGVGEGQPHRTARARPVDGADRRAGVVGEDQRLPARHTDPGQPPLRVPPQLGDQTRRMAVPHQPALGVVGVRRDLGAERVERADDPAGAVAVKHRGPATRVHEGHRPRGRLPPDTRARGERPPRSETLRGAPPAPVLAHQPQRVLPAGHHQLQLTHDQLAVGERDGDLREVTEREPPHPVQPGRDRRPGQTHGGHVLGERHGRLLLRMGGHRRRGLRTPSVGDQARAGV